MAEVERNREIFSRHRHRGAGDPARRFAKNAILIVCLGAFPALAQNQSLIQSLYKSGQELQGQSRFDEASAKYEKIIALDPSLPEAHANLGVARFLAGKYDQAAASFRQALARKPELARATMMLGLSAARTNRFEEARPLLNKAFELGPRDELWKQTGLALIEVGYALEDLDGALAALRTLQQAFPQDPKILYLAYRIHSDLGTRAVSALARSAPDSALVHQVAGDLMAAEGDYASAADQYRRALEADGKLPGIRRALASVLVPLSREEEAQRLLDEELRLNPLDDGAHYLLGQLMLRSGHTESARAHLERALAIRPNFVDTLVALAKLRADEGNLNSALAALERAVQLDPEHEAARYRLSLAYRGAARTAEADRELEQFRRLRAASQAIGNIDKQLRSRSSLDYPNPKEDQPR